jgi:hypothetical protein
VRRHTATDSASLDVQYNDRWHNFADNAAAGGSVPAMEEDAPAYVEQVASVEQL